MQHRPFKGQFQFLHGTDECFFDFFLFGFIYLFTYLFGEWCYRLSKIQPGLFNAAEQKNWAGTINDDGFCGHRKMDTF